MNGIFMSHSATDGRWVNVGELRDNAGFPLRLIGIGVPIPMAIGKVPMPAGIGRAMSLGVGPHIIMAAGIGTRNLAGSGCRKRNGLPRGYLS